MGFQLKVNHFCEFGQNLRYVFFLLYSNVHLVGALHTNSIQVEVIWRTEHQFKVSVLYELASALKKLPQSKGNKPNRTHFKEQKYSSKNGFFNLSTWIKKRGPSYFWRSFNMKKIFKKYKNAYFFRCSSSETTCRYSILKFRIACLLFSGEKIWQNFQKWPSMWSIITASLRKFGWELYSIKIYKLKSYSVHIQFDIKGRSEVGYQNCYQRIFRPSTFH